jgi:transposase
MSITMIGVDTAKSVFQLHGVDETGRPAIKRKLNRSDLLPFFQRQPACLVVMEACGAAHYWARALRGLGHEVQLIAPEAVKPFVKKGKKNDAADAAALCAAASRPDTKFVPIKSPEQQGLLALHTVRSLLVKQRTMLTNSIRGLATEFGLVAPKGIHKIDELVERVEADPETPIPARLAIKELYNRCLEVETSLEVVGRSIVSHARNDNLARRLATIPGVGVITASLISATVADATVFARARDFAAWLGLVPRQNSTGGKTRLGRITKAGNREIRTYLVLGATAMIRRAEGWNSKAGTWTRSLLQRRPTRLVTVALANKMARIAWAVMTRNEIYHAEGRVVPATTAAT